MPITPQEALQRTIEHREIFDDEMFDLMRQVMRGVGDLAPRFLLHPQADHDRRGHLRRS